MKRAVPTFRDDDEIRARSDDAASSSFLRRDVDIDLILREIDTQLKPAMATPSDRSPRNQSTMGDWSHSNLATTRATTPPSLRRDGVLSPGTQSRNRTPRELGAEGGNSERLLSDQIDHAKKLLELKEWRLAACFATTELLSRWPQGADGYFVAAVAFFELREWEDADRFIALCLRVVDVESVQEQFASKVDPSCQLVRERFSGSMLKARQFLETLQRQTKKALKRKDYRDRIGGGKSSVRAAALWSFSHGLSPAHRAILLRLIALTIWTVCCVIVGAYLLGGAFCSIASPVQLVSEPQPARTRSHSGLFRLPDYWPVI